MTFFGADSIGGWEFKKGASNYVFTTQDPNSLTFVASGIHIHRGSHVTIVHNHTLDFANSSTAGSANINNHGTTHFFDSSNAGHAHIVNNNVVLFGTSISAGQAVITTTSGSLVYFNANSDGGAARFITKAGGTTDFSVSSGPGSLHVIHAGSIEGAGTYYLGGNDLTVGSKNRSTNVSGLIADGGTGSGTGATLEKVGLGTLKLSHANNSFTGGIVVTAGTLDIAALGAAGTSFNSNIVFASGSTDHRGTLKVENAAFSGHHFTTEIQLFSGNDKLLLPGLKFKPHAKATYNSDDGILTVKSGHVTDTFDQFFNAAEGKYKAISDGHGGTKVVVVAAHAKADHADSFAFKASVVQSPTHHSTPLLPLMFKSTSARISAALASLQSPPTPCTMGWTSGITTSSSVSYARP